MNAVIAQQQRSDNVLDLGTRVRIDLRELARHEGRPIDQLIAALEMTTTLTDLDVTFFNYDPLPENNSRIIEPLCRCLSNLRCRNEHHPLRALTLDSAQLRDRGNLAGFAEFLIAATKYGGIRHVKLNHVYDLFIRFLVEFCQHNNNLKVLELTNVRVFSYGRAAMSLPPNRTQDSAVMLALDKLSLVNLYFLNSKTATTFADFIARMTVRTMVLGKIKAIGASADDFPMTESILLKMKLPSVNQLELDISCRSEHFEAALEAGTTSLIELDVVIDYDENDLTERLELLANFFRSAVQLQSLKIRDRRPLTPPSPIFRAIEACATVTQIDVSINSQHDFSQLLEGIRTRNEELAGFVASPSTYPTDKLLGLMRQFDNCPTGRYMLARNLPVVLSFEKITSTDSSATEPNSKKRKTE